MIENEYTSDSEEDTEVSMEETRPLPLPVTGYENTEAIRTAEQAPQSSNSVKWKRMYENKSYDEADYDVGKRAKKNKPAIPSGVKKRRAILAYQYGVCLQTLTVLIL